MICLTDSEPVNGENLLLLVVTVCRERDVLPGCCKSCRVKSGHRQEGSLMKSSSRTQQILDLFTMLQPFFLPEEYWKLCV